MTFSSPTEDQAAPDAAIEVVEYDDSWPLKFEVEKAILEAKLQPWLVGRIEHIGSTAVPGLAAKPVIDIMAPVTSLASSVGAIEAASGLGYVHYPYKAESMHWFCKPSPSHRTHHLHLVPIASSLWNERLVFRNALRQSEALAAEYRELKLRLAQTFRADREAYTEGKASFVHRVLASARSRLANAP